MTIPVPLDQLSATLERFGSAVLATLPAGTWPRVVTVDPYVDGLQLVVPAPPQTCLRHVGVNPLVTLYWATPQRHGYALIVDGWASVDGSDLRIRLDHAVLHRPSAHAEGPAAPAM